MPSDELHPGRSPARTVAWWVLRAAGLYAALMVAWLLVGPAYGAVFRGTCDFVLGGNWANVRTQFVPLDAVTELIDPRLAAFADVAIDLRHQVTSARAIRVIDSKFFGYVPTVVLVALVLATPVPWRRRGRALAWGLPLVHVLIAARTGLYLLSVLAGPTLRALDPPSSVRAVLEASSAVIAQSTLASYVLPVILWAALVFRAGDWERLFGGGGSRAG